MTAFFYHLNYELRTGLRDRSMMLLNYLFPLFFYAMMGALMGSINPGFKDTMIPAMIVFGMMTNALLGLPNPIVSARESGIYRSYRINNIPAISILAALVIGSIGHILAISAIITATAHPLFEGRLPENWGLFALVTLAAAFCMAGLGALIGVISPNGRATVLFGQSIYIPSVMLGGLMMPLSILPPTLAKVAMILPGTHIMNAYNGLSMGLESSFSAWGSLGLLAASGALAFGLAVYLFRWDSRIANKRPAGLAALALLPFVASILWVL